MAKKIALKGAVRIARMKKYEELDQASNGLYAIPSSERACNTRAAVKRSKELGRPLTEEEYRRFCVIK